MLQSGGKMDIAQAKKECRKKIKQQLAQLSAEQRQLWDAQLVQRVLALSQYAAAKCVFCYVSMADEVCLDALLTQILHDGKQLAVPLILGPRHMQAVRIDSPDELKSGSYGIREPQYNAQWLDAAQIDLAIVPGLGFAADGRRLGRGGGYYDSWLADFCGVSVAVAYPCQIVDNLPCEPHDQRVDILITPW